MSKGINTPKGNKKSKFENMDYQNFLKKFFNATFPHKLIDYILDLSAKEIAISLSKQIKKSLLAIEHPNRFTVSEQRANIVFNSKTFNIDNFNPNHGKDGKFCSGNYAEYIKIIQTDKFKKLDDNLKNTIEFIFCTPPVYNITGNEFPKNGEDLNTRVFNYYKEKYNSHTLIYNGFCYINIISA